MRRFIHTFLLAAFLLVISQTAHGQDRNFGLGAAVGGPDGISFKSWTNDTSALSGLLSFSISDANSSFYVHADYLIHKFYDELDWEVGRLHYYYGGGIGYEWYDLAIDDQVSVRLPAGFGFNFEDVPVDLFFELAPSFNVSPEFNFFFNGNMGFRFYLN